MTDADVDVAVVGGGIAGASVAYHLGARGASVTVFERGDLAGETTAKSAAFFGFYGDAVQRRMKRYAMDLYNDFLASPRADPRYRLVGRLRVATTDAGADDLAAFARTDDPDPGQAVDYLGPGDLRESVVLPELAVDRITGATYRPNVGYFRPRELAREFVARARDCGAAFETGAAVTDVLVEDGRATGVVADGDRVAADAVVCAAGPWNSAVAAGVGLDLPLRHTLAPVLLLDPAGGLPHELPVVTHRESGVYLRGHEGNITAADGRGEGRVLVGHYPTGGYDAATEYDPDEVPDAVPAGLRETMLDGVGDLFPPLADAGVVDEWVGVRSATPDGNPIAGPTRVDGFWVVGFSSSGIQLAPAAGRTVAAQVAGGDPDDFAADLTADLAVDRFESGSG